MDEGGLVWVLRTPHTNSLPSAGGAESLPKNVARERDRFVTKNRAFRCFDLAADYERKAQQAEAIEASLRSPRVAI